MPAWSRISSPAATSSRRPSSSPAPACRRSARSCASCSAVCGRVGHGLRGEDHQQAVAVRVLRGDLQRLGVALGVGVAQDVDRVGVAPGGGQERVERRDGGRRPARPARRRFSIRASVASTPGPPALVTIASRGPARPRLLGQHLGHVEELARSCRRAARRTRRNAASSTSSLPASEPVCDAAALAAASVRPALITMIGLVSATSRAAERNDRASPIDSM